MPPPSPLTVLRLGLGGLGLMALGLRLWGLGRFNTLIFDEVYYVPFALGYLNGTPAFDAHPPLGKYAIALGIWLGQGFATGWHWPTVAVEGYQLSPLSFRTMNAIVGATLPLVIGALAFHLSLGYEVSRRLRFSLLAGGLMVMEGLTLVESRLALINLYWLWFGLVGQGCWLAAARSVHAPRWRMGAGLALGAAVNVKWNGAGFWLGLVLWELSARWGPGGRIPGAARLLPWRTLLFYLGLLPLLTYGLLWWPHLSLTGDSVWVIHQRLWSAHQTIGQDSQPHPYCSAWYTWPLMLRPVAYFHQAVGPPSPEAMLAPYRAYGNPIFTLQGMGNPLLWWLGTAAVLALGLAWVSRWRLGKAPMAAQPVEAFILVNYLANWLPWSLVSRCTFLYHALGLVAFSTLALAWLLARWLSDRRPAHRRMAWAMVGVIALGFLFWLPLFLGLPLSPEAVQRRWWLPTWI